MKAKVTPAQFIRPFLSHREGIPRVGYLRDVTPFWIANGNDNTKHAARQHEDPLSTFVMHMGAFGQRLREASTRNGGAFVELCF